MNKIKYYQQYTLHMKMVIKLNTMRTMISRWSEES